MSWLAALPSHPIFTLPPPRPDTALDSTTDRDTDRPAKSAISHSASSKFLFGLSTAQGQSPSRTHAASTTPRRAALAASTSRTHAHGVERKVKGAPTSRMVVARGTDLVVAVGSELRLASLAEVKARAGTDAVDGEPELGDYKVRLQTRALVKK